MQNNLSYLGTYLFIILCELPIATGMVDAFIGKIIEDTK